MPPRRTTRGSGRHRNGRDRVDSRWWYWVAAVPATFGLWAFAVLWVGVALVLGDLGGASPIGRAIEISLVAFAVPFLALTVVFPFATYADATAVHAAAVDWRPPVGPLVAVAAVGPVVAIGALVFGQMARTSYVLPLYAVLVGFLLAVPVATYYCYRRHERLGVP